MIILLRTLTPAHIFFIIIVIVVSRPIIIYVLFAMMISICLLVSWHFIEVLEHVRLLVRRIVPYIILDGFNLLDKIELIFLSQVIKVKFYLFFRNCLLGCIFAWAFQTKIAIVVVCNCTIVKLRSIRCI